MTMNGIRKDLSLSHSAWMAAALLALVAAVSLAWWGVKEARRQAAPVTVATLAERLGYTLDDVANGQPVPRVYLPELPPDLPAVPDPAARKEMFLTILLPLILSANEEIAADRQRLLRLKAIQDRGGAWRGRDAAWLRALADDYEAEGGDLDVLIRRVDIIPPSLALAQAGIESGWGTSRFAQSGNALYGQRLWKSRGMVPARRRTGEQHRVRAFTDLRETVRAYMNNLNTHENYATLRRLREDMRMLGRLPSGLELAPHLMSYSERGEAYVADIHAVIRANGLAAFNDARLASNRLCFCP